MAKAKKRKDANELACDWMNTGEQRCLPRVWSPAFTKAFRDGYKAGYKAARRAGGGKKC